MSGRAGRAYRAHCVFCGRDAPADAERCPRCGGGLFLELDLEHSLPRPRRTRVTVRGRQPSDASEGKEPAGTW